MAETYSLSVTAMDANNTRFTPAPLTIGDSAGLAGGQQYVMRLGQQVLWLVDLRFAACVLGNPLPVRHLSSWHDICQS